MRKLQSAHGGDDPGKVGVNGTKEKDVNLAISKCLKKVLEDNGFDVVMTRNKDEILNEGGKFSKVGDLNKICSIINNTSSKQIYKHKCKRCPKLFL